MAIHPSQELKLLGSEKPYEYERSQYTHELSSIVARGSKLTALLSVHPGVRKFKLIPTGPVSYTHLRAHET